MPRSGWNSALAQRTAVVDPTASIRIDGRALGASDLRQRYDQWLGLDSLPGNVELLPDGGVRLKATGTLGPNSTIVTAYARDKASLAAAPYIDPIQSPEQGAPPYKNRLAALVHWFGLRSPPMELTQVQAWLHPRFDSSKPKSVVRWKLDLYNLKRTATVGPSQTPITAWQLQPIASSIVQAQGEAAGWVSFSWPSGQRPRPKAWPPPNATDSVIQGVQQPLTVLIVTGMDASGNPAANIGWGYDGGHSSATVNFDILSGILFRWLPPNALPLSGNGLVQDMAASPGWVDMRGASSSVPAIQLSYAQYTAATISFTSGGNRLDLGSAPSAPPEAAIRAEVPLGCAVAGQLSADNVNFYGYSDSDTVDKIGPGLPSQQQYYWKATLTPNATADATPILRLAGVQAVVVTDLSEVAQVKSVDWVVDPFKLVPRLPELTLQALHDGDRDFRDAISLFISQQAIGGLSFRLWAGDKKLPRSQWMHLDDFLLDDLQFEAGATEITAIHPLGLLKQALPVLTPENAAIPIADLSNPGGWVPSAGALLFQQVADGGGPADDTAWISSPNNPNEASCTLQLSGIGTPTLPGGGAQLVGIEVQLRAMMAAAGSVNLRVELLEGAVQRAVRTFVVNSTSVALLSLPLTPAQISLIGNWSNLFLRITAASGSGTVRLTWMRLAQLSMRPPLSYANQTIGAVAQDLLANQVGLAGRYRGPAIVDPSPALTVSKTIRALSGGATDLGMAKSELDALSWILGGAQLPEQGRIRFRSFFDLIALGANGASFQPRADEIVASFASEELQPVSVTPGYRQRVPKFFILWGYNASDGSWQGEAQGYSGPAFLNFNDARVDADPRLDPTTAQWFADQTLALAVAQRQVNCFGLGLLQWRFRTAVRHPELTLGDLVSIETDRFLGFDPISARALAGRAQVTAFVVGIHGPWGQDLEVWVPTWANIVPIVTQTPSAQPPPTPQGAALLSVLPYWRANGLRVTCQGNATVGSIKVATSNASFPAAGSGTAIDGQSCIADGGSWAYGDTVFGTVTPYAGIGGSGLQGTPVQFQIQLSSGEGVFDPPTGRPNRKQPFADNFFAVAAADPAGLGAVRQARIDGQARTLAQMITYLVPNSEFDIWES